MKVKIEMDMTPEEARAFLGLPDMAALRQKMLEEMQARAKAAFDDGDPQGVMAAWAAQAKSFEQFQKMLWDGALSGAGGPAREDKP